MTDPMQVAILRIVDLIYVVCACLAASTLSYILKMQIDPWRRK